MSESSSELRYADLVEESSARLPMLAPQWTDHNPSDPGISTVELIAWMTELVTYRTERISERSQQAMFGLLQGTDPPALLEGSALQDALADAITDVRSTWRVVTAQDWERCILQEWLHHPRAEAMGLPAQIGRVHVVPDQDLEAADPETPRPNHVTVLVMPAHQSWTYSGTIVQSYPVFSLRMAKPGTLPITMIYARQYGGLQIIGAGGAVVARNPRRIFEGETWEADITTAGLGLAGDLRIYSEWRWRLLRVAVGSLRFDHWIRSHDTERWVVLDRAIPLRGTGVVRVIVEWPEPVECTVRFRNRDNQNRRWTTATGFIALWHEFGPSATGDEDSPVRLWVHTREPDYSLTLNVRIDRFERHDPIAEGFLPNELWHFLDERRLIGIRHHVMTPTYQRLVVRGTVYLKCGIPASLANSRIMHALCDLLDPHIGGPGGEGWPFDCPVHLTDIIAELEQVPGIDYVEELTVSLPDQPDQHLVHEGETYGVAFRAGELPFFDAESSSFTLYERR